MATFTAPRTLVSWLLTLALLPACATRNTPDAGDFDAIPVQDCDPRVPNLGQGAMAPSCAPESIIDINTQALRQGNDLHIRVDTLNRLNELHPMCVDRDSSEAVLRYTAPPELSTGPQVLAIRATTVTCATEYDTVLSIRNGCGPEFTDYTCDNDGFTDDGLETRKSTVYFLNVEPEQYVYILLDGFDASAGQAEVIVTEFPELGVLDAPCIPVPSTLSTDPNATVEGYRCPHPGIQCQPGAAADGTDLCVPLLPLGAPCDPSQRRDTCEATYLRGVTCSVNPTDATQTVCALPGTAAGAPCRPAIPRCDGRLACSPRLGPNETDVCVPIVGMGASCDPSPVAFTDACDAGLTCCGDEPDAGASFTCRGAGWSPCFPYVAPSP